MSLFNSRALGRCAPSPVPWPGPACRGSPCWSVMVLFSRIPALALVQVREHPLSGKLRRGDAGGDADAVVGPPQTAKPGIAAIPALIRPILPRWPTVY